MGFPIHEMDDDFDPSDDGTDFRRDLVRLCGHDAADVFLKSFSGSKFRVPYRPTRNSRLSQAIGLEKAVAFACEYGGEVLDVPMGELSATKQRTELIRSMILGGQPTLQISREAGCTDRAVRLARAKLRSKGLLA